MNIQYISLGSFCHPKIFLRNTNREILKSLPFDFHSSPNTYSIYKILNKLYNQKTYKHEFKDILFEHNCNENNKNELAVSDKEDIFFLHFFDMNDKLTKNNEYPISIENNLCEEKIIEVQNKFMKRYEHLYNILNNDKDLIVLLRIENYKNPSWKSDIKNLADSLKQYNNKNLFLIYTQIEIDDDLDFHQNNKINYDHGFPILYFKKFFDEKMTNDEIMNKDFSIVLKKFENIVHICYLISFKNTLHYYYYDRVNRVLFKLNDINIVYKVKNINKKKIEMLYNDKIIVFFKNNLNIYECISDY